MAPLRPQLSVHAGPRKSILKESSRSKGTQSDSLFPTTKKDKRAIKHAQLLSKVAKSATPRPQTRRPNKKLVTTLDALGDALPDNEESDTAQTGANVDRQVNVIKRKSIKSRPGAMKRREKIDKGERDRFAKNMAQMAGGISTHESRQASNTSQSADRWKALRGFIEQTMEKKPDAK